MRQLDNPHVEVQNCPLVITARAPYGSFGRYDITGFNTASHPDEMKGSSHLRTSIFFQSTDPKKEGWNGLTIESLLAVCADRLQGFQDGLWPCTENDMALSCIQEAIGHLNNRATRVAEGRLEPKQSSQDNSVDNPTPINLVAEISVSRPTITQDDIPPGQNLFDPDHPEEALVVINIGTTHRQSGSQRLASLLARFLQGEGYEKVGIDKTIQENAQFQGMFPELHTALVEHQKKIPVVIYLQPPGMLDTDTSDYDIQSLHDMAAKRKAESYRHREALPEHLQVKQTFGVSEEEATKTTPLQGYAEDGGIIKYE